MLPIKESYAPMEGLLCEDLPPGDNYQFEPKWDGFRCLAFRDGEKIDLRSKTGQPLGRYFPELSEALLAVAAEKFVLDGEIVIQSGGQFHFDLLLERIHPAESRVRRLAKESPCAFIVFDLLVDSEGNSLVEKRLDERRRLLENFADRFLAGNGQIVLSIATDDRFVAREWLNQPTSELDGVMAKRVDLSYQSGNRKGMFKVKKMKTADCVIGGFRFAQDKPVLGSLLLGLYDDHGLLHHVGFSSSFVAAEKARLIEKLKPLIEPPGFTGNAPGGPSRWSTDRSTEWQPLKPVLVAEVRYDHFTGGRFRHGTKLLRWRPDKDARSCTMDQVTAPIKPFQPQP